MLRIVTLIAFFFTATAVQAAGVATGGTAPVVAPAAPAAASAATCREVQVALPNIKTLPERVREYAAATKALRLVVSINATAGAITSEDMVACNDGLSVVPTGVPGEIAFSNAPGGG